MIETILKTVIGYFVPLLLGYLINSLVNFKKKETKLAEEVKQIKESQLMDMKSDLSNKFYIYNAKEEVEDYLVMAFREKCERYFSLGGNTWIHELYESSKKWKVKPTGFLK